MLLQPMFFSHIATIFTYGILDKASERKCHISFLDFQSYCVIYFPIFFIVLKILEPYVKVEPPSVRVPVRLRIAQPAYNGLDVICEQKIHIN